MSWLTDFKSGDSKWESWPKVGEVKDFDVAKIEKVMDPKNKFNFNKKEDIQGPDGNTYKVDKNLGYCYVFTFKNGKKATLSRWPLAFALMKAKVDEGMSIKVSHPKDGEWLVEVLGEKEWDALN